MDLDLGNYKEAFRNVELFAACASKLTLRSYQRQVATAIANSVLRKLGLSFVVEFPRQSGKNELQAQIETYLLALLQIEDTEIVKVSPTWKPQTQNAMRRLQRVLEGNLVTHKCWVKELGVHIPDRAGADHLPFRFPNGKRSGGNRLYPIGMR